MFASREDCILFDFHNRKRGRPNLSYSQSTNLSKMPTKNILYQRWIINVEWTSEKLEEMNHFFAFKLIFQFIFKKNKITLKK